MWRPCSSCSLLLLTKNFPVGLMKGGTLHELGGLSLEICVCACLCAHSVCGIRRAYPMHVSHVFVFFSPFQQDSLYHLPDMSLEAFDLTQNKPWI